MPHKSRSCQIFPPRYGVDEIAEAADKAREEREEEERKVVLGPGTIALAKCWRGTVETQVSLVSCCKKFLLIVVRVVFLTAAHND